MTPNQLLESIASGKLPRVILIGGDSDYLTEQTFHAVRDRVLETDPSIQLEQFAESTDLGTVLDAFRSMSLFARGRLLVVPEVNAFVTKKEIASLHEKAISDWTSAKTDRKRNSALGKMLHILGLIGADVEESDGSIAAALGLKKLAAASVEMLEQARAGGKRASRGEGDAALLAEAVRQGGAPGATLLMRTGEIPGDSATVRVIEQAGAVVVCNLRREDVSAVLERGIRALAVEQDVRFEAGAVSALRQRLGVDRILADKFSRDLPDLRLVLSEAERLATFVGAGGTVTAAVVASQIEVIGGGARYEFASLFAEKKPLEAIAKLRDLVAQGRRDDPRTPVEIHYGKYLFPLADEVRQLLAIRAFARMHRIDLRRSMPYSRFRDTLAEPLSEYLKANLLVRQKPHPFALHKKVEAARDHDDESLFRALNDLAELEFTRKCGGVPAELGLEALVLATAG